MNDELKRVPQKSHYDVNYVADGRMFSYAHQIHHILSFAPRRILEVGPGPGVVTQALRAVGVDVITLDLEPTLEPDLQASVLDIPLDDQAVDAVICCQVLEHLPYQSFIPALQELKRVSSKGGVISLPDISPYYYLEARMPFFRKVGMHFSRSRWKPPAVPPLNRFERDGHFWEIGVAGYDIKTVRQGIRQSGWCLKRDWRVAEYSWHHFFLLGADLSNGCRGEQM